MGELLQCALMDLLPSVFRLVVTIHVHQVVINVSSERGEYLVAVLFIGGKRLTKC